MSRYAAKTEVSVQKSKMELEALVVRYGATSFLSYTNGYQASIGFSIAGRQVRFDMLLPAKDEKRFRIFLRGHREFQREPGAMEKLWEQECRTLWRALILVVKAKLEASEVGISTFEREFMANIVMTNGQLLHEQVTPKIAQMYESGTQIPLLLSPGEE